MKKILYLITQSETGGAQRYIFDLAANLRGEYNISVAFGEQGERGEFANELKNNGIEIYNIPHLKREISPLNDLLAIFEIVKLIKKLKPNIIHLNSSKISILGSIATKICYVLRVTCYVIYTAHGWVFNEPLPKWKKSFYFWAEKFTSHFKDKIICVNKLDYEIAKKDLRIKEEKLKLIYHGIRSIKFLPRDEARKKIISKIHNSEFMIHNSTIIIGTIANLYKTKGLEYLIEAIKILATYNLQLTTIIIGEGRERKNLENLVEKYSLEKNIFLPGNIKNAAELLPAFDIYACSSVKEGFPYSILEAMSAGLPIVATRVGGIPEIINDCKNGLLAESANPKDIAEKIKTLIDDQKLVNTLGEQARTDVKEKFGIEEMTKNTKNIYQ